jgi:L-Ala-D/L-Glu epimerase
MKLRFRRVDWQYASVFRISYRTQTHTHTVQVEIEDGPQVGRGEASGVSYHGETVDGMLDQLAAVARDVANGITRDELQRLLPPGGARNALDCALWDLEAKRAGRRVWDLLEMPAVRPLLTAYTLGLDTPEATGRAAAAVPQYALLKLKLNGEGDLERVAQVREARPDVELIVDANQAWSEQQLRSLAPELATLDVRLIEQPLPMDRDDALKDYRSPVPLCADESCQASESLHEVLDKYQYVNIKLDKTGGLTEAMRLALSARQQGLKLMAGCMGGSSLAMAPAFVVAQLCDVVDLDGPLLATSDMPSGVKYAGSVMGVPDPALWG